MNHSLKRGLLCALAASALPLASACSKIEEGDGGQNADAVAAEENIDPTLAVTLSDAGNLGTLSEAIEGAGLSSVFDGHGSYTLLAPNDAAFEKLGEQGDALMQDEQQALLVGVLRDHILPGHLTPEAIEKAIAAQEGPVTVSTLGEGNVTFAKEGDAIVVSNTGEATARFAGDAMAAANGVVIPLDTVLLPAEKEEDEAATGQ